MKGLALVREYRTPGELWRLSRDTIKLGRFSTLRPKVETPRNGIVAVYVRAFRANHARAILGLPHTLPEHSRDEDCTPGLDGVCACGVVQGPPCESCKGRSFHRKGCEESDMHHTGFFYCTNSECDGTIGCHVEPDVGPGISGLYVADIPDACPYCGRKIDEDWAAEEARELYYD